MNVWLGGLFIPEAYITATRQYVAQANSWSLEELSLQVTVTEGGQEKVTLDDRSFGVTGTCPKPISQLSMPLRLLRRCVVLVELSNAILCSGK